MVVVPRSARRRARHGARQTHAACEGHPCALFDPVGSHVLAGGLFTRYCHWFAPATHIFKIHQFEPPAGIAPRLRQIWGVFKTSDLVHDWVWNRVNTSLVYTKTGRVVHNSSIYQLSVFTVHRGSGPSQGPRLEKWFLKSVGDAKSCERHLPLCLYPRCFPQPMRHDGCEFFL